MNNSQKSTVVLQFRDDFEVQSRSTKLSKTSDNFYRNSTPVNRLHLPKHKNYKKVSQTSSITLSPLTLPEFGIDNTKHGIQYIKDYIKTGGGF